jgi:hypothetical protein
VTPQHQHLTPTSCSGHFLKIHFHFSTFLRFPSLLLDFALNSLECLNFVEITVVRWVVASSKANNNFDLDIKVTFAFDRARVAV